MKKKFKIDIHKNDGSHFLQQDIVHFQKNVMDELKAVLDSVKSTLISGGIAWYLDIESVSTYVEI